jgi:hypothetical protein
LPASTSSKPRPNSSLERIWRKTKKGKGGFPGDFLIPDHFLIPNHFFFDLKNSSIVYAVE